MNNFSDRLKTLRLRDELSQQQLADELKISKSSISMYERGEREPSFEILETFADFFNVDMNYLTGWTDDPHDWAQIGNEEGIFPPKDYEGTYEDYVKFKVYKESDDLIDSFYDTYNSAIDYLKSLNCQVNESPNSDNIIVTAPTGEHTTISMSDLVNNFKIFGDYQPGIKKLLTPQEFTGLKDEEKNIILKYRSIDEKGKHTVNTILEMEYNRCKASTNILNAAHAEENATEEEKKHDNDIMDNDEYWK
jgi:transcriptional regulator with XRE-family HTH domain